MEEIDLSLNSVEPKLRDFTKDVVEDISPTKEPHVFNTVPTHPTLQLNLKFQPSSATRKINTLRSDEDRMKLNELMRLCTTLQNKVLELEKTNTSQHNEIASLKRRVKKLEKRNRSRTHKLKRLYKVSLTARVESLDDEESLGEDASKQGRIKAIDAYEDITLVNDHDDADKDMFDVNVLGGEEVFAIAGQKEN
nr:hypothetical protein [Tanacetum cinerariifolium]